MIIVKLYNELIYNIGGSLRVGSLTVHKLGTLSFELPGHHTSDCIFPVGFRSTRIFWSMKTPLMRVLYTFEVNYLFVYINYIMLIILFILMFMIRFNHMNLMKQIHYKNCYIQFQDLL